MLNCRLSIMLYMWIINWAYITGCKITTRRYQCHSNRHGLQHGKWILIYPNVVPYTLLKLPCIRCCYLYDTPLLSSDHFKYVLVSHCSPTWGMTNMHVQDIIPKAIHTLGLLQRNVRTSSPQLKELTCMQGFSPTPARIRLYCMVPLVKIPYMECYWDIPAQCCPLHIQRLPFWLQCVHHDQKPPLGFLRSVLN